MKKIFFTLFIFICNLSFGQTQIGANINGPGPDSWFGESISMSNDGTIVAIGAPYNDNLNGINSGVTKIYNYNSGSWNLIGNEIYGEGANHRCGVSVALSGNGNIVAIGSHLAGGFGKVRIFYNNNGVWTQMGSDLIGTTSGEQFGQYISMSTDGTKLAIASQGYNGNGLYSGVVRVYNYNMNNWLQIGGDLLGDAAYDYAGYGVALSGDGTTLAVGSRYSDANGSNSGKTKIYNYISGNWTQKGNSINGENAEDLSGIDLSLSYNGQIIAIGASGNDDGGLDAGQVRVFSYDTGAWTQLGNDIDGEENSNSGHNISLSSDGTKIIIGSYNYNYGNGLAKIYNYTSNNWTQLGININSESMYENCGFDVSMSSDGTKVAVASRFNNTTGNASGNVRVFDLTSPLSLNNTSLIKYDLYPNPVKNILHLSSSNSQNIKQISVISALGEVIKSNESFPLNLSNLSKGIYFIKIVDNSNSVETKKIIVE